jgi:tetratricopeptide (TPR) repeat protein
VFQYAQNYQENSQYERSEYLLSSYLENHPNDQEIKATLAWTWLENGKWQQAADAYKEILEQQPHDANLHQQRGIALSKNLQPDFAIQHFEQALKLVPSFDNCTTHLAKALDIQRSFCEAQNPTKVPAVRILTPELNSDWEASEKIRMSTDLFEEHGTLLIENLFPTDLVKQIGRLVLSDKYASYYQDKDHQDALRIGDKRYMVTLDIEGPLNNPTLYANDFLCRVMHNLLGEDFVMGGLNIAVSIPGAEHQWQHRDHPTLFPDVEGYETSPSFAIGVLIPLIQLSEAMGSTEVIKGSHRRHQEPTEQMPRQTPIPDLGSCLLVDYRLSHRGLANASDQIRPMLCIIYHRAWFRDSTNYNKQAAVQISEAELNKVPEQHQHLFSWLK